MKVWLLAENWPPRQGGIENYITHIAEQVRDLGHQVVVLAPAGAGTHDEGKIPGIEVERHRFFWPLVRPAWLPLFINLWRRAKKERPDVILCGKGLFEGLVGYYLQRYLGIRYVVFTYAMEIAVWEGQGKTRRALQRVLHHAYRVVSINEVTHQALRKLGVSNEALVKLYPCVDERFLNNLSPSLVEGTITHFGLRQPYILSVGRLIPRKGFDTLIEAFSRLDQTKHAALKLVIVGEGPDRDRLQQIVVDNYINTSVTFLEGVEDKYLPALYAGAELFALTPRDEDGDIEGFGIVYLEAAAAARAVLATRTGGVPEAVEHEGTGVVVPAGDIPAVVTGLERLLADKDLRQRLGQTGQERVRREFVWSARREALSALLGPKT